MTMMANRRNGRAVRTTVRMGALVVALTFTTASCSGGDLLGSLLDSIFGGGSETPSPTTVPPSTAPPTTAAPTTAVPTTAGPTTVPPTTAAPTTAPPSTAPPSTAAPTTAAPPPDIAAALFARNCAGCHGETGDDGTAPRLDPLYAQTNDKAMTLATVTNGTPNGMPSFAGTMTEAEIAAVVDYVHDVLGAP